VNLKIKPIRLSYVLTTEEIAAALTISGKSGIKPVKSAIQTGLLTALFVLFTVYAVLDPKQFQYYFFAVISLISAPVPVLLPRKTLKRRAAAFADGTRLDVSVSTGKIDVEGFFVKWSVPLDETCRVFEGGGVFATQAEGGHLLCIPLRAVPEGVLERVRECLRIGI
jgi:hypothetical protein